MNRYHYTVFLDNGGTFSCYHDTDKYNQDLGVFEFESGDGSKDVVNGHELIRYVRQPAATSAQSE